MIKDYILERSKSFPNDVFLIFNDVKITYSNFNFSINKFLFYINSQYQPNSRILIYLKSEIDILAALIACNRSGMTPIVVPVGLITFTIDEYKLISQADYVLKDQHYITQEIRNNEESYFFRGDDVQCVLFTSGTSGLPKAVELTFSSIYNSAVNWEPIFCPSKNKIYLNALPIHHISGLSIFFRCIFYNIKYIFIHWDKHTILSELIKYHCDYISLVPTMIYDLMREEGSASLLRKIKLVVVGGSSINDNIFKYLRSNQINSYISYGMTETGSGVSGYYVQNLDEFSQGYVGLPHKNVKISVVQNNILIQSNSIMKSYTGGTSCNGEFLTEDIGEIRDDQIRILSRGGSFIISGGENINLNYIEQKLNSNNDLFTCIVVGFKDDKWGEVPIILYKIKESIILLSEVESHCRKKLDKHMVPKYFIQINEIPLINDKQLDYDLINYYIKASLK